MNVSRETFIKCFQQHANSDIRHDVISFKTAAANALQAGKQKGIKT